MKTDEHTAAVVVRCDLGTSIRSSVFVFPNSQGSAATHLRSGAKCYLYYSGNFMCFPAVKKIVKIC